jgi:hypothetical protein
VRTTVRRVSLPCCTPQSAIHRPVPISHRKNVVPCHSQSMRCRSNRVRFSSTRASAVTRKKLHEAFLHRHHLSVAWPTQPQRVRPSSVCCVFVVTSRWRAAPQMVWSARAADAQTMAPEVKWAGSWAATTCMHGRASDDRAFAVRHLARCLCIYRTRIPIDFAPSVSP